VKFVEKDVHECILEIAKIVNFCIVYIAVLEKVEWGLRD
jgi:hypothetical protein